MALECEYCGKKFDNLFLIKRHQKSVACQRVAKIILNLRKEIKDLKNKVDELTKIAEKSKSKDKDKDKDKDDLMKLSDEECIRYSTLIKPFDTGINIRRNHLSQDQLDHLFNYLLKRGKYEAKLEYFRMIYLSNPSNIFLTNHKELTAYGFNGDVWKFLNWNRDVIIRPANEFALIYFEKFLPRLDEVKTLIDNQNITTAYPNIITVYVSMERDYEEYKKVPNKTLNLFIKDLCDPESKKEIKNIIRNLTLPNALKIISCRNKLRLTHDVKVLLSDTESKNNSENDTSDLLTEPHNFIL